MGEISGQELWKVSSETVFLSKNIRHALANLSSHSIAKATGIYPCTFTTV